MQDHPCSRLLPWLALLLPLPLLGGCSTRGDLGREPTPTLVERSFDATANRVREFVGHDELPDLPFSAAEDALRTSVADIASLDLKDPLYRGRHGDGFAEIEALTVDLQVARERFQLFVRAATRSMQIDDARERRLKDIDALETRRNLNLVRQRRRENTELVHTGLRLMRRRLSDEHSQLQQLSVDWPDVPIGEAEAAYDVCMEDVIAFHASVDSHDHDRLGGRRSGYKR